MTLFFLTSLFQHLPQAVLAAIVMVAVSGLVDWKKRCFSGAWIKAWLRRCGRKLEPKRRTGKAIL